jgi:hypothetical protein
MLVVTTAITVNASAIISGIVSDSAGVPIKGIYVALRTTVGGGAILSLDTTDATGAYKMTCDSTSGKYVLRSTDPKNIYFVQNDTLWLDGMDKPIDIKMGRPKYSKLSGSVTDSVTGESIINAKVRIETKTDSTDENGNYRIDSVQSGARTVSVSAEGYYSKSISFTMPYSAFTFNIKLVKLRNNTMSGTIRDSLSNKVIAQAIIQIATKTATTDALGEFSIDSLHLGVQTIRVSATGYYSKSITVTMPDSAMTVNIKLEKLRLNSLSGTITDSVSHQKIKGALVSIGTMECTTDTAGHYYFDTLSMGYRTMTVSASGYVSRNLTVTISDTALVLNIALIKIGMGAISGTVYDSASGAAVFGAFVILNSQNGSTIKVDTTGSDGKFMFDSVQTGNYSIRTSVSGYNRKDVSISIVNSTQLNVTIWLKPVIVFTVSGKILDSASGAPVYWASVELRNSSNVKIDTMSSGDNGVYSFEGVSPGFRIRVIANNYVVRTITLTATSSKAQTINISIIKSKTALLNRTRSTTKETVTIVADRLLISNLSEAGNFRILNLKGETVFNQMVPEAASECIMLGQKLSTGSYILSVNRKNKSLMQRFFVR